MIENIVQSSRGIHKLGDLESVRTWSSFTLTNSKLCLYRRLTLLDNVVDQRANTSVNPDRNLVSVLEVNSGLLDEAHALRCAGHNDRTGEQCRALGKECNRLTHIEYLVAAFIGKSREK